MPFEINWISINKKYSEKMKKQIRLFAVIIMMIASLTGFAQKPFAGKIVFEMTAEGISDPNVAAQLAEATQEIIVMGNNSRMEANQGIDVITISNGDAKTYTVILGIPGYGKYYVKQTAEDLEKKMQTSKVDYEYLSDTKTIAGYKCTKVIEKVTDLETDEEKTSVLWVTTELGLGDNINFFEHPGLKGYPLASENKTELNGEECTIITSATSVTPDKKVKATQFLLPSDAKDIKEAPEELKQMLGMTGEEE